MPNFLVYVTGAVRRSKKESKGQWMEKRLEAKLELDELEMRALYLQMVFT